MWNNNALGLSGYGSDSTSESEKEESKLDIEFKEIKVCEKGNEEKKGEVKNEVPQHVNIQRVKSTAERLQELLPSQPEGPCDPTTQAKIDKFLQHKESGLSFTASLRSKKEFDNPYILEKVVEYFGIEEMQSNFDKDVFDPYGYDIADYYDNLTLALKKEQERKAMLRDNDPTSRWG